MKNRKFRNTRGTYHTVTPFPGWEDKTNKHGLFDDCPLCLALKRDIEAGRAWAVPSTREPGDDLPDISDRDSDADPPDDDLEAEYASGFPNQRCREN